MVAYKPLEIIGKPHVHIGDNQPINLHLNFEMLDYLAKEGSQCLKVRNLIQERAEELIKFLTGILHP
ncbi:MAG: hypothetical protein DI543_03030 [Bradyrhizobium icense]|nr:MAG: hypothetical protein DI543_03030 [Bradyrhizobium icense]